jgi:hypothetical protein
VVLLQNTAEGGVSGQAVTAANSGGASGDAFSSVNGTWTYSGSQMAHGALSVAPSANPSTLVWALASVSQAAARFYLRLSNTPTAAGIVQVFYTGGSTTHAGRLVVTTGRQLTVQNSNNTAVSTLSQALALDTWYRIEVQVTIGASATTGGYLVQLFQGDSTTALASYSNSSAATVGTTAITSCAIGRVSGTGWVGGPFFDDLAVQDAATAIGPYRALTGAATLTGSGTLAASGTASSAVVDVPAASGGDDQTLLAGIFANATAGQTIRFPANSVYKHSGKLTLTGASKANITIAGQGTQLIATTPSAASLGVFDGANNVSISNLRHSVQGATSRINQGTDVAPFVFWNVTLGTLTDLTSEGSAGLGFYFWKATGGSLLRLISKTSLADGIHFTNGSGGFTATDCQSLDAGDDGFAHIGYLSDGAETGRPQNITLVRPYVRDSRARGISYAGAKDCTATDVNIDGSLAANVYFAVERGDFNTGATDRCTVTRGRLARAGTSYAAIPNGTNGTGLDQGAVLWLSSGSAAAVTDCKLADVNIGNLAAVNYDTLRAIQYGGTFSGCSATGINLYAGSPNTFVGGNTPASITPATSTDRRTQALPAYGSGTTPTTRPKPNGLVRQLRADSITGVSDGAPVTAWTDTAAGWTFGSRNRALPKYVASGANGQPAVRFDGNADMQVQNATGRAQPFTTVAAVKASSVIAGQQTIHWHGADGGEFYIEAGRWSAYAGAGLADPNVTNQQLAIITVVYNSANSALYVNGTLVASGNLGTTGMSGQYIVLGDHGTISRPWTGDLYGHDTYDHVLTSSERAQAHSEAQDRYGVTVADYVPAAPAYTGTATLTGSGTLSATGTPSSTGAASLTGTGTLAATGVASSSGTATLTGCGALTATGAPAVTGAASLTGSGTLTATGSPAGSSTAPLTGTGALTAVGGANATQTAALSGAGTLTATGTAAQNGAATAALTGSGTLAATGTPRYTQVVTMTGAGTVTATGKASTTGTAALTGTGTVAATGVAASSSTADLSGTGVLTVATAAQFAAAAQLSGLGQLTAVRADAPAYVSHTYGTVTIAPHLGTATLTAQQLGTAILASDGTSTATIAAAVGTAVLNTDTL